MLPFQNFQQSPVGLKSSVHLDSADVHESVDPAKVFPNCLEDYLQILQKGLKNNLSLEQIPGFSKATKKD